MLFTRERLERDEATALAPYAAISSRSKGRLYPEEEAMYRTAYQKDRDRVIHTSAFRRLEYKTQVFVNYEGDYYRTRLTHTLEVAQVAKSISRALGLSGDLTETIALAHDLGHPPFGHAGERTLNRLAADEGGFDHNKQSLRVVTELETRYTDFPGLNLTWETLEGIMKHEKIALPQALHGTLTRADWEPDKQPTLEAQVVNVADELAYNAHDLDDGLRSGHLTGTQIGEVALVGELMHTLNIDPHALTNETRYLLIRKLLGQMISDTIHATHTQLRENGVQTSEDVRRAANTLVRTSPEMSERLRDLKDFLFQNLYRHYRLIRMTKKADRILESLFCAYLETPAMLPFHLQARAEEKGVVRTVTDYLAGMTDRFAGDEYKRLFDPHALT